MPKLPSAQNVSKVSPRVASDPGVQAPAKAFESPVGIAAQELVPVIDKFQEIKLRQDNRRDTIDRSKKINQYNRDADNELRQLNAKEDLSDDEVLGKYGAFLNERRQTLLGQHGGSEDSRARLTVRLQDIEAAATGRAAGISAKIGLDNIDTTFNEGLTPIIQTVAQDPSLKNIDRAFNELEVQFDDIRGAVDQKNEKAVLQAGQERIVFGAIDQLLSKGRVDEAEGLLIEGGLDKFLSAAAQRTTKRRIDTIRLKKEETLKNIGPLVEVFDPTSPTRTRFVTRAQAVGKPGKPKAPVPINVPTSRLQETVTTQIDADPVLGQLEEADKIKSSFAVASRVEEIRKESPGTNADDALQIAIQELSDKVIPGEEGTFNPAALFTEERFGFDAPPTISDVPTGLPKGTVNIGGGQFRLPDGRVVRQKQ